MQITTKTIAKKETYTISRLYVDGKYFCDTLEDCIRNGKKIAHVTAIPRGTYEIQWTYSNRFKQFMPLLCNVPNFSGIRIHAGNTSADTDGCILVGKNDVVGKVLLSRLFTWRLYTLIKKAIDKNERVTITLE